MAYELIGMRLACIALLCSFCTLPQYAAPNPPLYFEQNVGQTDPRAHYIARGGTLTAWIRPDGLTLGAQGRAVSLRVLGASGQASFTAENAVEGVTNYYLGSRAITGLPHYKRVRVTNVRPGIDIVYYGTGREIEYDIAIHAGADASSIRLHFDGAERPSLDSNGDLILKTSWGELRQRKPRVRQAGEEVACRYAVTRSGDVRLVLGTYRRQAELVVDPILTFSTYLGGNQTDEPEGIAADGSGYVYITGTTTSVNFPITNGTTFQGSVGVFVTKMNPSGTALVYSTYVGNTYDEKANAIAVDSMGNAYITGYTVASIGNYVFPLTYGQFGGDQDAFVVKLGSTGNILYSTIIGGGGNDYGSGIAVDSVGAVYMVGTTLSTNFPRTASPLRTTLGGNSDAFVAKLQPSGQITYATNFGGSSDDSATSVAFDGFGNAYIAGLTTSTDFQITAGSYTTIAKGGGQDAFVSVVNPSGMAFVYSTYLGGSGADFAAGIAVDGMGNAYVTGTTTSGDFPVLGAFQPTRANGTFYPSVTGFVTKLNPAGTALVYSSYLGGSGSETPVAIAVDSNDSAYVSGTSTSSDFPTTPGALRRTNTESSSLAGIADIFLVQVSPDGMALTYSTLLGSSSFENSRGMAIDANHGVYITGTTTGFTLPTTAGAFQSSNPKTTNFVPFDTAWVAKIDMSSPTLCNAAVAPTSANVPGRGGPISFNLTLAPGCPWEAVPPSYITMAMPVSGMGSSNAIPISGTVSINNDTINPRSGTIQVGNATFTVNQSAGSCLDPILNPSAANYDSSGGLREISVTLPSGCNWTAVPSQPWLAVTMNSSGTGPGTITIYAGQNSFSQRSANLTIAGKAVTVTQAGSTCTASASSPITSFNGQGGTGVVRIAPSLPSCNWAAYTTVSWIQFSGAANGQGTGAVPFVVGGNPGNSSRSGQLLIGDQLITINQGAGPGGTIGSYAPSIFAGGAYSGNPLGDGGPATLASLSGPRGLAFDPATRNLYIADAGDARVRVVTPDGTINTFAGGGSSTADNITATTASLASPSAVGVDGSGSVYVTDATRARKITQGTINTVAGGLGTGGTGDNGPAISALLNNPSGVGVDKNGNVYIADTGNNRVREVSGGTITNFAGGGNSGLGDNGPAINAMFSGPSGIAIDSSNNVYVADRGNSRIRKIVGTTITTVAGGGGGGDGGPATSASLSNPAAVAIDFAGNLFIADSGNNSVRKVALDGTISTIFSGPYSSSPSGVATDPWGNVYFTETQFFPSFAPVVEILTPIVTPCTYAVSAPPAQPIAGGSLNISVTTTAGCNWSASSDLAWATTSSTGSGSGTASIIIAPSGGGTRSGTIYVAGQPVLISQNPAAVHNTRDIRGIGVSDAVIYDASNGQEYTALSNGSGGFSYVPNLFTPGFDTLRFGDFNGDGKADLVLYNSTTSLAYIGIGDGTGHFAFQSLFWSPGYDQVVAGDLNGDGKTDFVLYRSTDGTLYTALSNSDGTFTYKYTLVSSGYNVTVADFNGDGKADVFLYRIGDGLANLGLSDGNGGFAFIPVIASSGYSAVQAGDINGDGVADLVLYNGGNGNAVVGLSGGTGFTFTPQIFSPGFTSVRLLDFNGDGKADAALYNSHTAVGYLGVGDGTAAFTFGSLFWGAGVDTVDVLDLNGDGRADVILYNSQNAATYSGISTGNAANPFTYQYSYWGTNRVFAK